MTESENDKAPLPPLPPEDDAISMSPVFDSGDAPSAPFTPTPEEGTMPGAAAEPSARERVSPNLDDLLSDPAGRDRPADAPDALPEQQPPPAPPEVTSSDPAGWAPPAPPPLAPPPAAYPPPPPTGYGTAPLHPPPLAPPAGAPVFTPHAAPPRIPVALAGVQLATWGQRVWATLIDSLIAIVVAFIAGFGAVAIANGDDNLATGLILGAVVLWVLFSAAAFMARGGERNGQTLGKQAVGIRVVRDSAEPITFGFGMFREVVIRQLAIGGVGGFLLFPPILDILWPLWDESNRALHDMLAHTHVVKRGPTGASGLPST
jgi:uncharacterized RDD family membrane protein YckC